MLSPTVQTQASALLTFLSADDDTQRATVLTASAEELAQLLAGAIHLHHEITAEIYPLIDRAVRARWLDHGSRDFEVAYRTCSENISPRNPHFISGAGIEMSPEGYRAQLDAERADMEASYHDAHQKMERNWMRMQARTNRLLAALQEACGGVVDVAAIVRAHDAREERALLDGVLDPSSEVE